MRPSRSCLGWRTGTCIIWETAALVLKLVACSPQLPARGRVTLLLVTPAGPNCCLGIEHKLASFFAQAGRQAQCGTSQCFPLGFCRGINPALHEKAPIFCSDFFPNTALLPTSGTPAVGGQFNAAVACQKHQQHEQTQVGVAAL
jgi:hypothetical protein